MYIFNFRYRVRIWIYRSMVCMAHSWFTRGRIIEIPNFIRLQTFNLSFHHWIGLHVLLCRWQPPKTVDQINIKLKLHRTKTYDDSYFIDITITFDMPSKCNGIVFVLAKAQSVNVNSLLITKITIIIVYVSKMVLNICVIFRQIKFIICSVYDGSIRVLKFVS